MKLLREPLVHFLFIGAVIYLLYGVFAEPPAPVFGEVRERVGQEWKSDKSEELNEQFYENLRGQYSVIIEEPVKADDDSSQSNENLVNNELLAALQEQAR